jgi:hypothetical protein
MHQSAIMFVQERVRTVNLLDAYCSAIPREKRGFEASGA